MIGPAQRFIFCTPHPLMSKHRVPRDPKLLRVGGRLGKYKLTRRLGEGAFARVYAAFDTIEQRHVALKIPHTPDQETLDDALREVRVMGKLGHPHILALRSADFIDGHLVLTFPLGGESLDERLKRRVGRRRAVQYARQLLEGLAHAHDRKVVHRDIKPDNILVFSDGLRISDFGAARASCRTRYGTSVGTIGYMAPEQGLGRSSPRADVFSMGLVLYRMTTGRLLEWPFEWPGPGASRLATWPEEWSDFLHGALALHEHRRYANGERMLTAFERVEPLLLES